MKITIIIPLRLTTHRLYDEHERLRRIIKSAPEEYFDILIVDYGTGPDRIQELDVYKNISKNVSVHTVPEAIGSPFSIGRSRDIGVQCSKTPVIMFNDLDFICSSETYKRVYQEADRRNYHTQGYDFMIVPTIFLSPTGTDVFLDMFDNQGKQYYADQAFHDYALKGRRQYVEHTAFGGSALVINRYFYLTSGGHDTSFFGHGAEDFELYHRLAKAAPRTGRPAKYMENITNFDGRYEGFRAYFSLYGIDNWMRGLSTVHLSHPRREMTDASYRRSATNFKLLKKRMAENESGHNTIMPLQDVHASGKTLVLCDLNSKPAAALRDALPALGDYNFISEKDLKDPEHLLKTVRNQSVTRVLMLNPYGNQKRLSFYRALRETDVEVMAFDRGALPDSWFFDTGGFLAESPIYEQKNWDIDLKETETNLASEYIENLLISDETLESNGGRASTEYWRTKLSIGNRDVIFVALQRPNDTATRFFAGPCESMDGFLKWLQKLAESVDTASTVIVVKKHPLEDDAPEIDGVIYAPGTAHFYDLIDLCDKVVVMNSGVGLFSLIKNKPVIACGEAFYTHPGLAYQANSPEELISMVNSKITVDPKKVEKFVYHLVYNFYSFGKATYANRLDSDNKRITIVSGIDFASINNVGSNTIYLGERPNQVPLKSTMMRMMGSGKNTPAHAPAPAPAPAQAPSYKDARIALWKRVAIFFHVKSRSVPGVRHVVDLAFSTYHKANRD